MSCYPCVWGAPDDWQRPCRAGGLSSDEAEYGPGWLVRLRVTVLGALRYTGQLRRPRRLHVACVHLMHCIDSGRPARAWTDALINYSTFSTVNESYSQLDILIGFELGVAGSPLTYRVGPA